jgi:hypothetical protein
MVESDTAAISIAIFTAIFSGGISLISLYFTRKHDQKLADSNNTQQKELNKVKQLHELKLTSLQNDFNKELEEMRQKHSTDLETVKSNLERRKDEEAALRNYEYEARQRLYRDFEPLLFLLLEHSESAYNSILGLARTSGQGDLQPNIGWLSTDGYYKLSTIYRLLLPLAVFKLMQRRLTIFDLDLVPSYKAQYFFSKALYLSFTDHFDLAKGPPEIKGYDPEKATSQNILDEPEKYRMQGIFRGEMDDLTEALIRYEPKGNPRLMSFGEFKGKYSSEGAFRIIGDLFQDFHPRTMPVLWRILLAQAHIYRAIKKTREMKDSKILTVFRTLNMISPKERWESFNWRHKEMVSDEDVLVSPFKAVENYLKTKLPDFFETNKQTEEKER